MSEWEKRNFWMDAYIAAIASGGQIPQNVADIALKHLIEKFPHILDDQHIPG